jgi:hypothetical protein
MDIKIILLILEITSDKDNKGRGRNNKYNKLESD